MKQFRILEAGDLETARDYLGRLDFADGAATAFGLSRALKKNLEMDPRTQAGSEFSAYLATRIMSHPNTSWIVYPKTLTRPIVSRTPVGGAYGRHIDASQMQDIHGRQMRTDLSFTLFLSDPDSYDGGELSVQTETGDFVDFKEEAGEIVFYSSARLHEVKPVTRGERLVCIGWVESMIYDPDIRDALWALMDMQTALGRHVDKTSPVFQSYQLAVNSLRGSLIGRV